MWYESSEAMLSRRHWKTKRKCSRKDGHDECGDLVAFIRDKQRESQQFVMEAWQIVFRPRFACVFFHYTPTTPKTIPINPLVFHLTCPSLMKETIWVLAFFVDRNHRKITWLFCSWWMESLFRTHIVRLHLLDYSDERHPVIYWISLVS